MRFDADRLHPRLFLSAMVWLWLSARASLATEPPDAPLLRLETGVHTAAIKAIATDKAGRWIATASNDKSLRLWDAATGRLLRIDRPPIGDGYEGKLFAVAMDPGGRWVATGGWTGHAWDGQHSIYILDRASGQLLQRVGGLDNVIHHLCVSPDGRRLAAVLGGEEGLRVYAADADFSEVFSDPDYKADSYGCAFATDGRLITTSYDGQLRLYAPEANTFRLIAGQPLAADKRPYAVVFHPDGDRVAVGFDNQPAVEVFDGETLHLLYRADTSGLDNGNLGTLTWSLDGAQLFAGGTYHDGRGTPVLVWDNAGKGQRKLIRAVDNTVMDMVALPEGAIVVAGADPALMALTPTGSVRWQLAPAAADPRAIGDRFRVSADGRRVAFGFQVWGEDPAWLDLPQRQLHRGLLTAEHDSSWVLALQQALAERGYDPGPIDGAMGAATRLAAARYARDLELPSVPDAAEDPALVAALGLAPLAAPRISAPGVEIRGWNSGAEPTFNGQPMPLAPGEIARSLAIDPGHQRFLLGTEWRLRLFDLQGRPLWSRPAPGIAWGVNMTADGRFALGAFGDGTIRWYRIEDGSELLAFFAERGSNDWVLWTPSGYYDASPGGDRLIGWHLNNGRDKLADFVPASQLRERFYRPEVIAAVFDARDEAQAIVETGIQQPSEVAAALPPTVSLLEPLDGALFVNSELSLRYRVDTRNGGDATRLQVLVDGRPLAGARGLDRVESGDSAGTLKVTLPQRDLILSLIAENRNGASPPATVHLSWGGKAAEPFIAKPRLYLLAIGVSDYDDDALDLEFPAKDARDFARVIDIQRGGLYEDVEVRLVANGNGDAVLDGLDWLRAEVTAKDVGLLFLAGHGINDSDGDYYFLPADAKTDRLRRTGIAYYEIKKTLGALAGKTVAFIDTCHSGSIMGGRRGVADMTGIINDLAASENGVVVFASSSGQQYSLENADWGNGAFTKALVEGLSGQADYTKDSTITINQLDLYLSERVKELTDNRQTPTTTKPQTISDFPIAVIRDR